MMDAATANTNTNTNAAISTSSGNNNKVPTPASTTIKEGSSSCNGTSSCQQQQQQQQHYFWPPSSEVLRRLGLGSTDDTKWWKETAGLLPPNQWIVSGAYDLIGSSSSNKSSSSKSSSKQQKSQYSTASTSTATLDTNNYPNNNTASNEPIISATKSSSLTKPLPPPVLLESSTQVKRACSVLDGAIHGVTNVWTESSLLSITELMESDQFWLSRKGESFIKVYGGCYVLGQKRDDLQLILGADHSILTQTLCRAHNLVYALINLEFPAYPGFNTLIFGMNLRGSGFHYHQDSIPNLTAKNAPLLPNQPVVTTVLYEHIDDSGKECVFWKPILNFTPRASVTAAATTSQKKQDQQHYTKTNESLYLAARACVTQREYFNCSCC